MGYIEDMADLRGKVAIVVGGGGGLGRAATLGLARAGVNLAICDRDGEELERTRKDAEAAGVKVHARAFDARKLDELKAWFEEVDGVYGRQLDVLVNVVGGGFSAPFMQTSPNAWNAIISINFTWMIHSVHHAVERMAERGGGSIINFSSIEGHRAAPGWSVYAGMKSAVVGFSRSMAVELGPYNIRINTVDPDHLPTEATQRTRAQQSIPPEVEKAALEIGIPMARYGTYEDLAGSIVFLAGGMSKYITGSSLIIDGGTKASSGWFNWPGKWFQNMPPDDVAAFAIGQGGAGAG